MSVYTLAIESSCDDTSAAILKDNELLSNVIASQSVHAQYGGVVPELASRAHQQNIIPVVDTAIKQAGIACKDISLVAFTRGPGLLGSLLVGVSFAKAFAYSMNIPLVDVDHLQGHILSHFIKKETPAPQFPFLCLCVSGGHTQILRINSPFDMQVVGTTIDDAAGEAFDKAAKILGFPYPGGAEAFTFSKANIAGYDYSFSGLKTSFLYFLRDKLKENQNFIQENMADLCASMQKAIIDSLMKKLVMASKNLKIKEIAIAGGVSANSGLQQAITDLSKKYGWTIHIPSFKLSTDNAAMIGIAGYFKYLNHEFCSIDVTPYTQQNFGKLE